MPVGRLLSAFQGNTVTQKSFIATIFLIGKTWLMLPGCSRKTCLILADVSWVFNIETHTKYIVGAPPEFAAFFGK